MSTLAAVALAAAAAGAAATPGTDLLSWALAQGPMGIALALIGYGWKREKDRADSEQRRGDAERSAKDALAREIIDKVVPALGESTRATADLIAYSRERS